MSRVAAGAVLAGAKTATGASTFFSVWHPELVALRAALGLPRHPAQIVVSGRGRIDVDATLLFNVPSVPVIVIAGEGCRRRCEDALRDRPWIHTVSLEHDDWGPVLQTLRTWHGIFRISVIGGRATATSLVDAGVVQELLLTTTSRHGGEPGTPPYAGDHPPGLAPVTSKRGNTDDGPIAIDHLLLQAPKLGRRVHSPA